MKTVRCFALAMTTLAVAASATGKASAQMEIAGAPMPAPNLAPADNWLARPGNGVVGEWIGDFRNSALRQRYGNAYLSIDAVLMNRNDAVSKPLAYDQTTGDVILRGDAPYFGYETLPRGTLGYVFGGGNALELTYFYKDDFDAHYDASAGVGNTSLVDPTSALGGLLIGSGSSLVDADQARVSLATRIQNAELNLVETGRIFNFIAGFRWMEIRDRMTLNSLNAAQEQGVVDISTYNSLYGGQAGLRTGYQRGLFGIDLQSKAGLFFNNAISHSSVYDQATLAAGGAPGFTGQLSRRADGKNESFVGELNGTITYRPTPSLNLRMGYQVMWICQMAQAVDQMVVSNPLNTGIAVNARGDMILHGPSAGAEFRW